MVRKRRGLVPWGGRTHPAARGEKPQHQAGAGQEPPGPGGCGAGGHGGRAGRRQGLCCLPPATGRARGPGPRPSASQFVPVASWREGQSQAAAEGPGRGFGASLGAGPRPRRAGDTKAHGRGTPRGRSPARDGFTPEKPAEARRGRGRSGGHTEPPETGAGGGRSPPDPTQGRAPRYRPPLSPPARPAPSPSAPGRVLPFCCCF